ncbi:hypothetical protein WKH56_05880 [Priestia sp. SB1]|uniref:Uncharacterized protein n=1 Tax=Priestia aryabhattai TaxID=412384 RepID=A0AAX6NCF4_PRIAR|nr:hypothetical protein [Priestia aryabhattai]MDU9693489.1 hypothetical protein [Priestia aryabhattai]
MWKDVLEYFYLEQETENMSCFRLKDRYVDAINQNFRFLLISQTEQYVVYYSYSQQNSSLVVNKREFGDREEAELYIRSEINEIIRKNLIYFVFGKFVK